LAPPTCEDLANAIIRFVLIETYEAKVDAKAPVGKEEFRAIKILNETTTFLGDRHEWRLFWRTENLADNSESALACFLRLEGRLVGEKILGKRYSNAINEYISLGHARKLSTEDAKVRPAGHTWFIPHHSVRNTAMLKVLDSKTNLIDVLIRFRKHPVALSADIVKMFHQLKVRSQNGPALRFITSIEARKSLRLPDGCLNFCCDMFTDNLRSCPPPSC
jgi:hypothetical protein